MATWQMSIPATRIIMVVRGHPIDRGRRTAKEEVRSIPPVEFADEHAPEPAKRARTRAGSYAWRRRQREMLPWAVGSLAFLLAYLALAVLSLAGRLPFWASLSLVPTMLVGWFFLGKVLDRIDARWGEGARGEFRVGEELERLHEEGFHVFHDWYSGRGNVDHFAVGPQGVFAIETKAWRGKIAAEGGRLFKDGRPLPGNAPVKQAMAQAMAVRTLVGEAHGAEPFVVPILCFSRATVSCHRPVGGVEVVGLGCLNRAITAGRRRRYSSEQVEGISRSLEDKLGVGPAAKPGAPPEGPSGARRAFERLLGVPDGPLVLGLLMALSLVFPAQVSKALLGFAYLYQLLAQALAGLL